MGGLRINLLIERVCVWGWGGDERVCVCGWGG